MDKHWTFVPFTRSCRISNRNHEPHRSCYNILCDSIFNSLVDLMTIITRSVFSYLHRFSEICMLSITLLTDKAVDHTVIRSSKDNMEDIRCLVTHCSCGDMQLSDYGAVCWGKVAESKKKREGRWDSLEVGRGKQISPLLKIGTIILPFLRHIAVLSLFTLDAFFSFSICFWAAADYLKDFHPPSFHGPFISADWTLFTVHDLPPFVPLCRGYSSIVSLFQVSASLQKKIKNTLKLIFMAGVTRAGLWVK